LLFSKGGFVSVPPVFTARLLNLPVWTHESDFSIGLANRINALFASKIWLTYEQSLSGLSAGLRNKAVVSGNPVRAVFYRCCSQEERGASVARGLAFLSVTGEPPVLLVLGGSQGALEVNTLIGKALPELTKRFVVVHQTGEKGEASPRPEPSARYIPLAYIKDEMPDLLACAALVVGRSGAGTVWECAACGKPMILVPLAGSGTRGDQVENARYFAEKGAAISLIHPTTEELVETVIRLTDTPGRLEAMAAAARKIGALNAAAFIAGEIRKNFFKMEPNAC
jgi:UDP-N-acetylglucosamine--N-acetylmuramyl-(pentapeptide) pyrophosphoryl-undecaprenol N-acetylglucosamine transferase